MSSPFLSELAKLDNSLQAFQSQLDRVRSGLEVDDSQLRQSAADAREHAAVLRNLVRAENANASWNDREALEHLILSLEIAADEKRIQQRRAKLLELAAELQVGSVKHRVTTRAAALNSLRLAAVEHLRAQAARPEQEMELPGPEASQWMHWACNLGGENDASVLADLHNNFAPLEEFLAAMEESFWIPGERAPETQTPPAEPVVRSAETPAPPAPRPIVPVSSSLGPLPQIVRARFDRAVHTGDFSEALSLCYEPPSEMPSVVETAEHPETTTPWQPGAVALATEPLPVPKADLPPPLKYCEKCGRTFPSRYQACPFDTSALQDLPDTISETPVAYSNPILNEVNEHGAAAAIVDAQDSWPVQMPAEQPLQDADGSTADSSRESAHGASPNFDELVLSKTPIVTWVAAAIIVALCAVFAWMHYFHAPSSGQPDGTTARAGSSVPGDARDSQIQVAHAAVNSDAPADSKPLLHRQPAEGAQDNILLSVELCEHSNSVGIECWGYISNQRDQDSKVSLYRVDVVDGKGNSFDLGSKGQSNFSSTHDFTIPAQSKVKYSIKVPDNDKDARTLTLYLDVNNPRGSEYTFRDVPVSD